MPHWLDELGFTGNPFYLDPVPSDRNAISKGFVDRLKERRACEDFMQFKGQRLLILGRVGEGKSSLLNLLDANATESGKLVLRIDALHAGTSEALMEVLLGQLAEKADKIPSKQREELGRALDDLKVISKKGRKGEKLAASVEGKLGAIVAYIKGKLGSEEIKAEEFEYFVPPRLRKLEGIATNLLPAIFDALPAAVLCDNLEKLPEAQFLAFVTEVIAALPNSVNIAATANIAELQPRTLQRCYEAFDVPILMERIDSPGKLTEFIEGRMAKHAKTGKPPIHLDSKALKFLLDRTGGNLRESFRYCLFALQRSKGDVKGSMMLEAIRDCDAPRFEILSETDRKLLDFLAREEDASLEQVFLAVRRSEGIETKDALRKRLDNLATPGFIRKTLVKRGRTYVVKYTLPNTLKQILGSR